jgi:hypothetical protein
MGGSVYDDKKNLRRKAQPRTNEIPHGREKSHDRMIEDARVTAEARECPFPRVALLDGEHHEPRPRFFIDGTSAPQALFQTDHSNGIEYNFHFFTEYRRPSTRVDARIPDCDR